MAQINRLTLAGNLTAQPTLRKIGPEQKPVVEVGMAINKTWTDQAGQVQKRTTFVDLAVWGRSAENFFKLCGKGDNVLVEGELSLGEWVDKQTGEIHKKHRVQVRAWSFLRKASKRAAAAEVVDETEAHDEGPTFEPMPEEGAAAVEEVVF
jgi:single-strand DNA-binding protein